MTASASALSSGPRYAPEDPRLPRPWKGLVDGSTGYLYYWNPETNVTQYERPVADLPAPPPLLLPLPSHPPPKSGSVAVSSTVLQSHHQKQRKRERDSYDDDGRYGRSRSSHQHGGGRGSSSHNHGYGAKDSQDSRTASARGHRSSSDGRGSVSVEAYRHQHEIIVTGDDVPAPYMTFESAGFPSEILKEVRYLLRGGANVVRCAARATLFPGREVHHAGFSVPTPIQAQSWPIALQSRDIVAIAKTGSGKTLGYLIPGFMHLKRLCNNFKMGPTVLVLSPTRELATQIQDEAVKFGRASRISCTCLYGGAPKGPQLRDLDRGVDVVVATPGRLNDILEMRRVSLRQVSYLVLDEADRMLDMGFEPQIRKIVKEIPNRRQTLMFTATWPKEVRKIAADLLVHHVQVNIGSIDDLVANNAITQYVEVITPMEKLRRLEQILRSQDPGSKILIFCSTKRMCDQLARTLTRQFGAAAIHGDKSQGERNRVLNQFRTGRSPILVATDVAARGLDIKDIRVVVNYDFPTGVEDYVHRIGRTGRAGATGVSYTFFCDQDSKYAADLVKVLEGADQHVPKELWDMVSRGGYGGKSRRWGSRSGARDGGCSRGRSDTSYRGRDVHGLLPSGRADSGRGSHGRDVLEPPHDRYGHGYQDGHEVEIRDRKSRGKRRSRSRSLSWNNSQRYSPSPVKGRVGWGNSCSRSWNHGHSRSRSRSRSPSRGIDQYGDRHGEEAGQTLRESPVSRRRVPSPINDQIGNPVDSSKMPSYEDQRGSPPYNGEDMERVQPDRSPSVQNETSECLYSNIDNGKQGISANPAQWHRGSPWDHGDAEGPNEGSVRSPLVPCNRSGEEEEEGMIPADGEDGVMPFEEGTTSPKMAAAEQPESSIDNIEN